MGIELRKCGCGNDYLSEYGDSICDECMWKAELKHKLKGIKKIAVDWDGVITDTVASLLEIYNSIHRTNFVKDDITKWNIEEILNISEDDLWNLIDYMQKTAKIGLEDERCPEILNNLCKKYAVEIVTCNNNLSNYIEKRKKKYGLPDMPIRNLKKYEIKATYPYDLFIDDSPNQAYAMNMNKKLCLLYDHQWNKNVNGEYIVRVKNWDEIQKILMNDEQDDYKQPY